jgi:hypothetical protein
VGVGIEITESQSPLQGGKKRGATEEMFVEINLD